MFSPTGRLTSFSPKQRIEDVFTRFLNLSERERGSAFLDREQVMRSLNLLGMMNGTNAAASPSTTSQIRQELRLEINALLQPIHAAEEKLSMYEPDPGKMTSMEELEACEKQLESLLYTVIKRKMSLTSKEKASEEEMSTEANLLAYDNPFNQQIFDSAVISDTTSERNNIFFTTMVPSDIKGNSSNLNVEKSQAANDNSILSWPNMSLFK